MSFVAVSRPVVVNPYRRKLQKIWSAVAVALVAVLVLSAAITYLVVGIGAPARPPIPSADVR